MSDLREAVEGLRDELRNENPRHVHYEHDQLLADELTRILDAHPDQERCPTCGSDDPRFIDMPERRFVNATEHGSRCSDPFHDQ